MPVNPELPDAPVKKEPGQQTEITGIHIDIPDGSLKLRIERIAPAGRIKPEGIPPVTLKKHDDSKKNDTAACGP